MYQEFWTADIRTCLVPRHVFYISGNALIIIKKAVLVSLWSGLVCSVKFTEVDWLTWDKVSLCETFPFSCPFLILFSEFSFSILQKPNIVDMVCHIPENKPNPSRAKCQEIMDHHQLKKKKKSIFSKGLKSWHLNDRSFLARPGWFGSGCGSISSEPLFSHEDWISSEVTAFEKFPPGNFSVHLFSSYHQIGRTETEWTGRKKELICTPLSRI